MDLKKNIFKLMSRISGGDTYIIGFSFILWTRYISKQSNMVVEK